MATPKKKQTTKPRVQLELARKLWQRPYPVTATVVRRQMQEYREAFLLTRDEFEVLEILISAIARSWEGSAG